MCAQVRKFISRLGSSPSLSSSGGKVNKGLDPDYRSFMGKPPATPETVKEDVVQVYVKDANRNSITLGIKVSPNDPRFEIRKLNFVLKVGDREIKPDQEKPNEKKKAVLPEKSLSKKEAVSLGKPIEKTVTVEYDKILRTMWDQVTEGGGGGLEIEYEVDLELGIKVLWEFMDIVVPISTKGKIMIPNMCQMGKSTILNIVKTSMLSS